MYSCRLWKNSRTPEEKKVHGFYAYLVLCTIYAEQNETTGTVLASYRLPDITYGARKTRARLRNYAAYTK